MFIKGQGFSLDQANKPWVRQRFVEQLDNFGTRLGEFPDTSRTDQFLRFKQNESRRRG